MPFVPKTPNRKEIDEKGLNACTSVGDICYYYYREMVDRWNIEPRWTTAHNIYREVKYSSIDGRVTSDENVACELAWQVFFQLHVMPYEFKKRDENGDIV